MKKEFTNSAHGFGNQGLTEHADKPFAIVGILEATGTAVDRTVHISLESMSALHLDWVAGAPVPGLSIPQNYVEKFDLRPKRARVPPLVRARTPVRSREPGAADLRNARRDGRDGGLHLRGQRAAAARRQRALRRCRGRVGVAAVPQGALARRADRQPGRVRRMPGLPAASRSSTVGTRTCRCAAAPADTAGPSSE